MEALNMAKIFTEQSIIGEIKEKIRYTHNFGFENLRGLYEDVDFIHLDHDYVGNVLTEDFLTSHANLLINSAQPWLISAQTGTGKSTFILKTLLPIAMKKGKKILYLVSRKAQKKHMKVEAMRDYMNGNLRAGYSLTCKCKELDENMIECISEFGGLRVFSYQEFLYESERINFDDFLFAVMDEAHFFLSDSDFNRYTDEILQKIVAFCKHFVRIYMSATAEDVADVIYRYERNNIPETIKFGSIFRLHVVYMDDDYSYLNPIFFRERKDIISQIEESSKETAWLIFIRTKDEGMSLKSELESRIGETCEYITADNNDKENSAVLSILEEECLKSRITISTKVLDLGVNLKMDNLRIVLYDDDPVEIRQMIGRRRVSLSDKRPVLNVYFHIPTLSDLQKRKRNILSMMNNFTEVKEKNERGFCDTLSFPFYNSKLHILYNHLTTEKWKNDVVRYDQLIEDIQKNEDVKCEFSYAKNILQYLNKAPVFNDIMILSNNDNSSESEVREILQKWLTKGIFSKNEFEIFSEELQRVLGDPRKDTRAERKLPKLNSRNKQIEKYGVSIKSFVKKGSTQYFLQYTGMED